MELVYAFIRDRQVCGKREFNERHPHHVVVFKKALASPDGETTLVPVVPEELRDTMRVLRHEAHQYRVLQLKPSTTVLVGRATDNGLVLADDSVSRKHARMLVGADGRIKVEDLGSDNGTFVGKQRVTTEHAVRSGEVVQWGKVQTPVFNPDAFFDFLTTLLDPRAAPGHE